MTTYARAFNGNVAHRIAVDGNALCRDGRLRLGPTRYTRDQVQNSPYLTLCRNCEAKARKEAR